MKLAMSVLRAMSDGWFVTINIFIEAFSYIIRALCQQETQSGATFVNQLQDAIGHARLISTKDVKTCRHRGEHFITTFNPSTCTPKPTPAPYASSQITIQRHHMH